MKLSQWIELLTEIKDIYGDIDVIDENGKILTPVFVIENNVPVFKLS